MFILNLNRKEHMCQICNRNTSGTERLRLKRENKFVASMHFECAFGVSWTETVIAESVPLKKNVIKVKQT